MNLKSHASLVIFLVLALLVFAFSWTKHIVFTDEIIYEEFSYQMFTTGDYLAPNQEGAVWLIRPPLYFWITALAYRIIPPTPFSRRLVTLIAAAAIIALTYKLAARFFSGKAARWSMILLATTPLFLFFTKAANLDIPLAFFILATILAYEKAKIRPQWLMLAGIACGLGILTRSFLALTPIPVILIDQMFEKRKIPVKHIALALALSLTIALPWHLVVWKKYPQAFVQDYLKFNLADHLFAQTPGHQPISMIRFLANVLVIYNPLAVLALGNLLPQRSRTRKNLRLFLIWIAASLVPLSLAVTRHEWYAIQALPPIAILGGSGLVRIEEAVRRRLNDRRISLLKMFGLSVLLTLPTVVFLNMPKETKSVATLNQFLKRTPTGTPLYNLENRYTPQSTLYNPRETPVIDPEELESIVAPLYVYADDDRQYELIKEKTQSCCEWEIIARDRNAKVVFINPR
jgi:4-amino-4-deoxy-L-arabinose transferase-like glycosyltransferase